MQAGEIRKGVTFEYDNQVYTVVDFMHVKPGKGSAFVRTTLKNVITGKNLQTTFNPNEKLEETQVDVVEMQYLYADGDNYVFMNTETYEQMELNREIVADILQYLQDNMIVKIRSYKGTVFAVEPPTFVELEVTYTEPGIKGATSTGQTKPATVDTGATFQVPIFVEIGDKIRVDTRTGEYMERV